MEDDRTSIAPLISAEASVSAELYEACRWVIERQSEPVRFDVEDLPALGQGARLRLALPITAPRALLCTLWLLEDIDAGACLMAGQLRFVAHPTGSDIRLSFRGHIAPAIRSGLVRLQAGHAARQLLEVIAHSIARPSALAFAGG